MLLLLGHHVIVVVGSSTPFSTTVPNTLVVLILLTILFATGFDTPLDDDDDDDDGQANAWQRCGVHVEHGQETPWTQPHVSNAKPGRDRDWPTWLSIFYNDSIFW